MTDGWREKDGVLRYAEGSRVGFEDTLDHWQNGVCRLLEIEDAVGRRWVETAFKLAKDGVPLYDLPFDTACDVLGRAWSSALGLARTDTTARKLSSASGAANVLGHTPDTILAPAVRNNQDFAIVGTSGGQLGWTVDAATLAPPQAHTVVYDDGYFEGDQASTGYGNYLAQQGWRLEKARRYLRQLDGLARYLDVPLSTPPVLLDVGAAYGFFRKAADERGWQHYGIEVSRHARQVSSDLFGFDSSDDSLEAFASASAGNLDVVTLWDLLEHVVDPVALLRQTHRLLRASGIVVIRTPNVTAAEYKIFGPRYHSFKVEHLFYFGPLSLVEILHRAGFEVGFLTTESHLLRGFLGSRLDGFARLLRGSDLFAIGIKTTP